MVHRTSIFALLVFFVTLASAQAVQFGSQALPDGGVEYIVQIEPDLVDVLRQQPISSDIPPELHNVRRVRLMVGEGRLPQQNEISLPPPPDVPGRSAESTSGETAANINANPKATANPEPKKKAAAVQPEAGRGPVIGLFSLPYPGKAHPITPTETSPSEATNGDTNGASGVKPPSGSGTIPAGGTSENKVAQNAGTSIPKIGENDLPHSQGDHPADDGFRTFGAAMPPSSPDTPHNSEGPSTATPKPWFAFMGALLVLFASLGANVYLVWIHQTVRAKYHALVQRLPREAAVA